MTMDRSDLISLVERLRTGGVGQSEEAESRDLEVFERNVPHPQASGLIFYWNDWFNSEPTSEAIVDAALAYKPIEL